MPNKKLTTMLGGGDRRSIGRSNKVVALVLRQPKLLAELVKSLWSNDSLIRMRAADAIEKISQHKPELLVKFKAELLGLLLEAQQQELRWHLALLIPRLPLTMEERKRAATILRTYLNDKSSIVKTFALQGLADLSQSDAELLQQTIPLIEDAIETGTAAMKARARKLLKQIKGQSFADLTNSKIF